MNQIFVENQKKQKEKLFCIPLILIIIVEYLLFRTFIIREFLWAYPTGFDQSFYLNDSYVLLEKILNHDFKGALSMLQSSPQGILFPFQGAIFFLFFGASWFNALNINFIYFAITQIIVFFVYKSITKNIFIAFAGIGFFLMVRTTFFLNGGITDFRIDFAALCLFLIFISIVIKSDIFFSRKWSIVAAFSASILMLTRFLTGSYIFGISFSLLLIMWTYFKFTKSAENKNSIKIRLQNLVVFGLFVTFICLPFYILNFEVIKNYYFGGGVFSEDKFMWAKVAGITDCWGHILYYLKSFDTNHFGSIATLLGIFIIIISLITKLLNSKTRNPNPKLSLVLPYVFLCLSIVIPYIILTIDIAKSPVVADILVAPTICILLQLIIYLFNNQSSKSRFYKAILVFLIILILFLGLGNYISNTTKNTRMIKQMTNIEQVQKMYEDIGNYCIRTGITSPVIFVDQLQDYLLPSVLNVLYYEKTGKFLNASNNYSLFEQKHELYFEQLNKSDIVMFNDKDYQSTPGSCYPFDHDILKVKPLLLKEVKKQMFTLGRYSILGNDIHVYVRPSPKLEGTSDDYLLAKGTSIKIPKEVLNKISAIVLLGQSNLKYISNLSITAATENGIKLPTKVLMDSNKYALFFELPDYLGEINYDYLRINIAFNKFFIPKNLGINTDERKLVVMVPKVVKAILGMEKVGIPSDVGYVIGMYDDGWVGPNGASFVLVRSKNNPETKLKLTLNINVPQNAPETLPIEVAFSEKYKFRRDISNGNNNVVIDIPKELISASKLMQISITPLSFYSFPNDNRKLSFQLIEASIID